MASFSPGHGLREHDGTLTVVDPRGGPDDVARVRPISKTADYRDPWAFSEEAFLAACHGELVLMDGEGAVQTVFRLDERRRWPPAIECHEPRPLSARPREPIVASDSDAATVDRSRPGGGHPAGTQHAGREAG